MNSRSRRGRGTGGQPPGVAFVEIPQQAAVSLLAPLVQTIAASAGVRVLGIKGHALALQGLRLPRGIGDVDVLVDPARFDDLAALLRAHGWRDRDGKVFTPLPAAGSASMPHARTLEHPHWPCHLDMHRYYPGFLGPAQETFELIWATRDRIGDGSLRVDVPSRKDHWILATLHTIRSGDARQALDLRQRAQTAFADEMGSVVERAIQLHAFEPLREEFALLGEPGPTEPEEEPPLLAAWKRRLRDSRSDDDAFVEQLLDARGRTRIALLFRQVFPPPRSARAFHTVAPGLFGVATFYTRRLMAAPRYAFQYARILRRRWKP